MVELDLRMVPMKPKVPASRSSASSRMDIGEAKPLAPGPPRADTRLQYLVECFRAAHEEGMFRIRKRDHWLQLQLLVQVGLLSIAGGFEISGIKAANPYPDVLILASSASVIFVTLYFIENSLVGNLSKYVASLSTLEAQMSGGDLIPNWDASENYRSNYIRLTLPFRLIAQLMTFLFIPLAITIFRLSSMHRSPDTMLEASIHGALFIYTTFIIFLNYKRRARNAENLPQSDKGSSSGTTSGLNKPGI